MQIPSEDEILKHAARIERILQEFTKNIKVLADALNQNTKILDERLSTIDRRLDGK